MMENIVASFFSSSTTRRYLHFETITMMMHVMVKGSNSLGLLHTIIHRSIHSHMTKPSHGDVGWYIYDTEGQNNGDENGLKLFRNIISKWLRKNKKVLLTKSFMMSEKKMMLLQKHMQNDVYLNFHFHLNTRKIVKRRIISFKTTSSHFCFLEFYFHWIFFSSW